LATTLSVKDEEAESWKLHEIHGDHICSLPCDPQTMMVWTPHAPQNHEFSYFLAIERKNTCKRLSCHKTTTLGGGGGDKPLKIRGWSCECYVSPFAREKQNKEKHCSGFVVFHGKEYNACHRS